MHTAIPDQMQAITARAYGSPDVLRVEYVERPVPKDDEVRIRIKAATVSTTDATARSGRPYFSRLAFGLRRPKHTILGTEFAGIIDDIGAMVTRFKPGDAVFAASGTHFGAHAEYICLPETAAIAPMPVNLTFEEAAAFGEGALTALPFLRDTGSVKPGDRVLINGASGAVGTAAVQLAKHFGAEVTAVCSTANAELVTSIGSDAIIDYTREDFTSVGATWDIIFDAVGKRSFGRCRKALTPSGIYMTTVPSLAIFPQMLWTSKRGGKRAAIAATGLRKPAKRALDLVLIKDLAELGRLRRVIDTRCPLATIAMAHRRVDTGHKKGGVVVSIG